MSNQITVADFHAKFVSQIIEYPENDRPVHARWTEILRTFPQARGRRLSSAFDDVYQDVLKNGDIRTLDTALSLVQLQIRFWGSLIDSKLIYRHVWQYENTACFVWQMRLINKLESASPAHRKNGKIIPEEFSQEQPLLWLN